MIWIARLLAGAVALLFIATGLRFMLAPADMSMQFFVRADGAAGLSTLRGDLGGAFVGLGTLVLIGLRRGYQELLLAVVLVLVAIIVGRLIGYVVDGVELEAVRSAVVEVVLIAMLLAARSLLRRAA